MNKTDSQHPWDWKRLQGEPESGPMRNNNTVNKDRCIGDFIAGLIIGVFSAILALTIIL